MTATPDKKSVNSSGPKAEKEAEKEIARILEHILDSLDDLKGLEVHTINVTKISDVTDYMVLASGTSSRHVRSLVNRVTEDLKKTGVQPLGVEGKETSEWVLVDYGDVVLHVMQVETRRFYDLERLWSELPTESAQ